MNWDRRFGRRGLRSGDRSGTRWTCSGINTLLSVVSAGNRRSRRGFFDPFNRIKVQGLLAFFSLDFKVRFERGDLAFSTFESFGFEGGEGSVVEVVGVRDGFGLGEGTLITGEVEEEGIVLD